jgi:hypothetical protein
MNIHLKDGDSVMTIRLTDKMQVRRPSKGLTPMLTAVADALFKDDKKVLDFIGQCNDFSVLKGEERCG